ncbi:efflux RND transporter periplasmic adaptor subunit [Geoalkalibacter sp.]|uniref:efflux RND transporter periplasmic adaptor subunit n=1 Tax=Geoalkalibacter sp. TaxID=3041440 RepID=UPI00272E5E10|nr:HlyD family efflux transporter periplasmic adaptor subunit [Geoalkalibacter sp.]
MNVRQIPTADSETAQPAAPRGFGVFIELEKRARQAASEAELHFLMVNDTHELLPYRQALLWRFDRKDAGRIAAVSGLAAADPHAPFIVWMERVGRHLPTAAKEKMFPFRATDLPPELAEQWAEWLPPLALWVPLRYRGESLGALILAREGPWGDGEMHLLGYLADAYGHAWGGLRQTKKGPRLALLAGKKWLAAAALLLGAALIPVHQSALAPAEVIARDPVLVRAPMDGVIDRFEVRPNSPVHEGEPLVLLDGTRLLSRLEVAQKTLEVAEAEYRQAAQQAVFDSRAKVNLPVLQGRVEQHAAELAYLKSLRERTVIRAPRDGIAIFSDVNDWIGRPVVMGERILMIADPGATELEIRLAVADAIALEPGAAVRLFLNTDPHRPVDAKLRYAGYQASATPEGVFAYRLAAAFEPNEQPLRIGLKGTARVYGERTLLGLHLLRRPLAAVRKYLGI